MKTNDAWNYCDKLTREGAIVPINKETIDSLLCMFKEYQQVHHSLYEVGVRLHRCRSMEKLKKHAETPEEFNALLGAMALQVFDTECLVNKLLDGCEGVEND